MKADVTAHAIKVGDTEISTASKVLTTCIGRDNSSIQGWHMESQNHPITTATVTWDAKPAPANRMMAHLVSNMKGDGRRTLELLIMMEKMLMRHCVTHQASVHVCAIKFHISQQCFLCLKHPL